MRLETLDMRSLLTVGFSLRTTTPSISLRTTTPTPHPVRDVSSVAPNVPGRNRACSRYATGIPLGRIPNGMRDVVVRIHSTELSSLRDVWAQIQTLFRWLKPTAIEL